MVKNFLDKLKDRFSKKKDSSSDLQPETETQDESSNNLSLDKLPPALQKALAQENVDSSESKGNEPEEEQNFSFQEIKAPQESEENQEEPAQQSEESDEAVQQEDEFSKPEQILSEASASHTKTTWHSGLKKSFNLKLNNLSWRISRRNDDTTSSFKIPSTSNIRFEEFSKLVFAPKNRPLIHRVFLIALAVSVPYTAGKMLALGISPAADDKGSKPRPQTLSVAQDQDYKSQLDRVRLVNLFNATSAEISKKGPFICEKSEKRTSLPIRLVNTIVLQDSIKSIAAVQVRGSADNLTVREGDPVDNVAEIAKIERMRILIKNLESGECEFAENEDKVREQMTSKRFNILNPQAGKKLMANKATDGIRNVGNHFFIKKALREEAMKDMNNILTQARALQIRNADGSYAFKMTEIIPGSVYSKLNIQDGDVISGINGKRIENINELMNMFGRIKDIDNMSITLTREGQEQTLEYEFE